MQIAAHIPNIVVWKQGNYIQSQLYFLKYSFSLLSDGGRFTRTGEEEPGLSW